MYVWTLTEQRNRLTGEHYVQVREWADRPGRPLELTSWSFLHRYKWREPVRDGDIRAALELARRHIQGRRGATRYRGQISSADHVLEIWTSYPAANRVTHTAFAC